jgi:hypothetical protein
MHLNCIINRQVTESQKYASEKSSKFRASQKKLQHALKQEENEKLERGF